MTILKHIVLALIVINTCMVSLAQIPNITKLEYFIDSDPGHGLGVDIPITMATSLDESVNVPTGSLTEGFHIITVRAQDENGAWSLVENKAFFVSQSSTLAQNNIAKIEYFIDSDPGYGLGVDVPITPGTNLDILENIPTGSLSEGFHVLTIRAQDENGMWSLSESKAFYVNQSTTISQNNITKIEYFIDADPGRGLGVDVPITSAVNINILENVPTGALSEGFHVLTVRAQDENGLWSLSENKIFFVNLSSTITQNNITKIEYFIGADPGFGAGVDVPITSATNLDFIENIPTDTLNEGFYTLTVRAQDENGVWGLAENQVFYVSQSSSIVQNDITKIEYFIDSDPGHGLGVDIPITSAQNFDFLENVPTALLSEGFHTISVRALDQDLKWSLIESKPFYVSQSSTLTQNAISKLEFFIDSEPGHGLGIDIPITASTDLNILENIPTGSLSEGFHVITIRAQDENGEWSMQESKAFFVDQSSTLSQNSITGLEFYIDTDPGYGFGTDIPITASTNLDILENISTGSLSEGFHTLTIRAQDENGIWGLSKSKPFYVDKSRQIIAYEYAIDTDPGEGMATLQVVAPQDSIDLSFTISTDTLIVGAHNLYVRVKDENQFWGPTSIVPFTLCDGALTDFTTTTVCEGSTSSFTDNSTSVSGDIYSWDFNGDGIEDDNTAGSTTFIYPSAGTYSASLLVDRSGCKDSTTQMVTVENLPTSNAGTDQDICTNSTTLSASSANTGETGMWSIISGSGTFSDVNDPGAIFSNITSTSHQLRWTVTNDLLGCADIDEVIITSTQPIANAGPDQDLCSDSTVMAANSLNTGETGTWSVISGSGTFSDINDPGATFSNITAITNQVRWTVTNDLLGCTETDDIIITSAQPISNAGADQDICIDSTTLTANMPNTGETGTWSIISGSGTFSDVSEPDATFSNISSTVNQIRWTVSNDLLGCAASDDVIITSTQTTADAGPDQDICTDNTILAASLNSGENGTWSIISGSGTFSDVNDPNANFNNITESSNQLRWTVVDGLSGCTAFDQIIINSNLPISTSTVSANVALGEILVIDVQSVASINSGDILTTTITGQPIKGIASILAGGSIEYIPNEGTVGMDTVYFQLCNQCIHCTDSFLSIEIQNNSPVITTVPINSDNGNNVLTINLLQFIFDPNNNLDLSTLRIVQQPISGATAQIDTAQNLIVDYTGIIFVGTDELMIEICDFLGACTTETIFIEVNLPGDPPVTVFNVLSPNGDGKHDYLEIENITAYPNNSLIIFNRWGRKVYSGNNYDNNMVRFNGKGNAGGAGELPGGTYFYKLDLGNGNIVSGFIVIKI